MIINRIKLAQALLKLAAIKTDKGELTYEGELVEGIEVFIEKEGEIVPAEDGEYLTDEVKLTIKEGKIEKIEKIEEEPKEEPEEEPKEDEKLDEEPDEKDIKIKELEDLLAERDAVIEELTKKIEELEAKNKDVEEKLSMAAAEPAFKTIKNDEKFAADKSIKALKFFQK